MMRRYCAANLAFFGLLKLGKRAVFFLFDFVVRVDANAVLALNQVGILDSDRCQSI